MRLASRLIVVAATGLGLLLSHSSSAAPPPLGKLFFTPAERAAMGAPKPKTVPLVPPISTSSTESKSDEKKHVANADGVARNPRLRKEILTGYVQRSSGNHTIWVNHRPRYRQAPDQAPSEIAKLGEPLP